MFLYTFSLTWKLVPDSVFAVPLSVWQCDSVTLVMKTAKEDTASASEDMKMNEDMKEKIQEIFIVQNGDNFRILSCQRGKWTTPA